jgi:hypothetical protein
MELKKLPVYIQERIKRHIQDDLGVEFDPNNEGHMDMAEEYADMESELR